MNGRFFIRVLVFSVFLLLESVGINYGQAKRLQFTHLKSDNGLSSSIVTSILQDHKGLVWIGTYDGLNSMMVLILWFTETILLTPAALQIMLCEP